LLNLNGILKPSRIKEQKALRTRSNKIYLKLHKISELGCCCFMQYAVIGLANTLPINTIYENV
jgi:hypothetical protein